MVLGTSLEAFTLIHGWISLLGIGSGIVAMYGFSPRGCLSPARAATFLGVNFSFGFSASSAKHFLRIPTHWAPRLHPLRRRFPLLSRIVMLLRRLISLSTVIAPPECVDHW